MSDDYRRLAEQAQNGGLAVTGQVERGPAAARTGAMMLMEATGGGSVEDAIGIAMGRPKVGARQGLSPVVRARVAPAAKERLDRLAAARRTSESAIVRAAIDAYLAAQPV